MGEDPNAKSDDSHKLYIEIKNRWKVWLREGLPEEVRKNILKKYPRQGDLYMEPPKINLEIAAALTDIAKKRDQHFVDTHQCIGTAVISIGAAVSLLLEEKQEGIDQIKLLEYLSDAGKLLSDVFHQQSQARKSFITPVMNKSIKNLVESLHSDEYLYGEKLGGQIKEAKTIESACKNLKATEKTNRETSRGVPLRFR